MRGGDGHPNLVLVLICVGFSRLGSSDSSVCVCVGGGSLFSPFLENEVTLKQKEWEKELLEVSMPDHSIVLCPIPFHSSGKVTRVSCMQVFRKEKKPLKPQTSDKVEARLSPPDMSQELYFWVPVHYPSISIFDNVSSPLESDFWRLVYWIFAVFSSRKLVLVTHLSSSMIHSKIFLQE